MYAAPAVRASPILTAMAGVVGLWGASVRSYLMEFIGTFGLVFTIGASLYSQSPLAPLGIGSVLMVLVFAGGHISGAHYNPAITLGVLIRGRIRTSDVAPYMVAQLAGGVLGAAVARVMVNPGDLTALSFSGREIVTALIAEFVFTFLLVFVMLNVATSKDHPNNSFYGLAIGFTVTAGAIAVGSLSGAAFNPAVAVGVMVAGLLSWSTIWIYLLANLVAGAVAGYAFRVLNPDNLEPLAD